MPFTPTLTMVRMTKQKKILHEELEKFSTFFDAYELHDAVSSRNSKIGLATIYRFLNNLENHAAIHAFICNGKKIYSTNARSHAHFKCEKCGSINHINVKNVDFLKESVKGNVCHFQIELSGVCPNCN